MHLVVLAAVIASPADPAVVRVSAPDHASIESLSVVARRRRSSTHVTLTFELATVSAVPRELAMPIEVSRDIEVTGLEATVSGHTEIAIVAARTVARAHYDTIVTWKRDPALLEWTSGGWKTDRLTLHVFPVSWITPAVVTVELSIPRGANLVIDPGRTEIPRFQIDLDGGLVTSSVLASTQLVSFATAHDDPIAATDHVHVDRGTSLVTLTPIELAARRQADHWPWGVALAAQLEIHDVQLERCFAMVRDANSTIRTTIALAVSLAEDGSFMGLGLGGIDAPEFHDCLEHEMETWLFGASARTFVTILRL